MRIFLDDQDYRRFIALLGEVVEEFRVECWSYCVMPNHYHAALMPTLPNISRAMQRLNGEYAGWWNSRHGRVGHVFQGRFKSPIVQADGYLLHLCRYIAANPVRAGLTERPDDWPWSSYAATIGSRAAPRFLTVAPVLRQFGDAPHQVLRGRFAAFVQGAPDADIEDSFRSSARVVGSQEFERQVLLGAGQALPPADATDRLPDRMLVTDWGQTVV